MQSITLQTSDSIITSGDFLGRLGFAASSELDGADALLVAATIEAIAEGNFTQTSNATSLVFSTADSETALPKLKITSGGHFIPLASGTYDLGSASLPFRNLYVDGGYVTAPTGVFDVISFNVDNESILLKGQVAWNDTEGTLDVGLNGGGHHMAIGESRFFRVRNVTGSPLYKGQVVYATGVHSNGTITPAKFIANGTIDEIRFIGIVFYDINNNNNGYVVDFGQVRDLDLDGSVSNYAVGDETWVAGDILYAHPTVVGKLTNVEPKHAISVAIILDPGNGNGNGRMFVRPTNYGHLNDNHDVDVSGLLDNQFLVYDSGTDYWQPSSGLYYVDGDLGIGTPSPSQKLHVIGNTKIEGRQYVVGDFITLTSPSSNTSTVPTIEIKGIYNSVDSDTLKLAAWPNYAMIGNESTTPLNIQTLNSQQTRFGIGTQSSPGIVFYDGSNGVSDNDTGFWHPSSNNIGISTAGLERLRIDSAGNVGIGTYAPSVKLDVNGAIKTSSYIQFATTNGYIGGQTSNTLTYQADSHRFWNEAQTVEYATFNTSSVVFNDAGLNRDFRIEGSADPNLLFTDASTDRVGIGTASLYGKLNTAQTTTNQSSQQTFDIRSNNYSTSNGTYYTFGEYIYAKKYVNTGITDTGYTIGTEITSVLADEGTLSAAYGLRAYAGINNESNNGNLTVAYGVQSRVINFSQGTGNINTARGIDVYINGDLSSVGNGGITNAYGVYIQSILNSTNTYGLYQVGSSDKNYFAGNVGIGTANPSSKLNVELGNVAFNSLNGSYTFKVGSTARDDLFYVDGTSSDRVGIKTSSPDRDFHVNGETHLDGTTIIGTGLPSLGYRLTVNGNAKIDQLNINGNFTFPTTDGSTNQILVTDGGGSIAWQDQINLNQTVNGRLTLESGEPVSTTNQTAKTTLYFTPYKGNQIALYDGTAWGVHSFSELSLSLSGYTANTNYDIFIYDNSGTLTLESSAWTNNTTRATALTTQDGVYVKSGATTRRYLGTIRTTENTGQCTDSTARRLVWNLYNQRIRVLSSTITGTHTYSTATWRAYDNNTTRGQGFAEFVLGLTTETNAVVNAQLKYGYVGLGLDSTTTPTNNSVVHDGTNTGSGFRGSGFAMLYVDQGYHYYQIIELGLSGTSTFYFAQQTSYIRG